MATMRKNEILNVDDLIDQDLPLVLQQVAEAIGIATACRLAMDFGGREIYLPKRLSDKHPLVLSLGRPAAEQVVALLGDGAIEIPLGPTTYEARIGAAINKRLEAGQSEAQISRALRVHIRTVRRHRAKMKDTHPTLFD
jgi:hypothetical protein